MGPVSLEPCREPASLTQMFVMERDAGSEGAFVATDESVCLDSPDKDDRNKTPRVKMIACSGYPRQKWLRDTQVCRYRLKQCLELANLKFRQ